MPTVYPGAIPTFINPISSDDLDSGTVPHAGQHTDANDSIKAVMTELGTLPKGSFGTVKARLDDIDTKFAAKVSTSQLGVASGVATLDGSSKLVQNLDAAKMNSGTLALARLPLITSAKMDAASGALALALIPGLPASQITSGLITLARIPGLPGNWITSGTIDAARLPTSVTANANVRVEADIAAMNAILLGDRVNGMLVWTTAEKQLWKWRSSGSAWDHVAGGFRPTTNESTTDILGAAGTSFVAGTPVCGTVFTAPPSGIIWVNVTGHMEQNTSGNNAYLGAHIRNGSSLNLGTDFLVADTDHAVGVGFVTGTSNRVNNTTRFLVPGLTPGGSYNIVTEHVTTPAGSLDLFYRCVTVEYVV